MISLSDKVLSHCDILSNPRRSIDAITVCGVQVPETFCDVLNVANGFVTRNGFFRLFGTAALKDLPAIEEWNQSDWRQGYGSSFAGVTIIAEDVFGDQYGFDANVSGKPQLIKIYCEGGRRDQLCADSLEEFLSENVLVDHPTAYDHALAVRAYASGLRPAINEHLAFQLPLICGGEYSIENLDVEVASLHLGVLGQLTLQNTKVPDGTAIKRFTEM